MKKTSSAIALLSFLPFAQAGTMGPAATAPAYIPYLAGEASYTWAQTNDIVVNGDRANESHQGWGGRLGAGALLPFNSTWSFMSEIGGGYYGSQRQTLTTPTGARSLTNKFSIDGYDILMGGMYNWDNMGLFGQAGFMVQNIRATSTQNISLVTDSTYLSGVITQKRDFTQVYPEIKVGGIYNLTPNWGLSVAYMHVFGSTPSFNVTYGGSAVTGISDNGSSNLENPTLNSVMFGLRYNFTA